MNTISNSLIFAILLLLAVGCHNAPASGGEHEHAAEHSDEDNHDGCELSREQMQAVGIELGEISRMNLGASLRATGELAVDPQDEASVVPLTAGIVKQILVKQGDKVAKGQTVAYVEIVELIGLQQEYFAAKQEEVLARQELERQNALAAAGAGIKKNLQQAAANAQIASAKTTMLAKQLALYGIAAARLTQEKAVTAVPLMAPVSGIVTQVLGTTGSYADAQTPLMKIVNNSAIYAKLRIFEKDLADLAAGEQVELCLTNRPDIVLQGEVVSIIQAVEQDTKALTARVRIKSPKDVILTPQMPVIGVIAGGKSEVDALPDEAIVSAEGRNYVFVLEEDEHEAHEHGHDKDEELAHFKKIEVITGVKERGYTEVKFLSAPHGKDAKHPSYLRFVIKNAFYLGSMTTEHAEHAH